ncbi:MAG: beta-lactamase family protein [Actinobacteria bacterium]|nr:MAG: beta-lactamase family protein [Actinomycetota bacterium]
MDALRQVEDWPAANVSVGVARGGAAVAQHGDVVRHYRWASVTKLVTALATLVAAEEGTVDLDEPAGPEGSTVRHLLAHAAGLPFEAGPPISRVGRRRTYSNAGFEALADHVAARAEMPFDEYLLGAVLRPLGLAAELRGSPASGLHGSLDDLLLLASELQRPQLIAAETLAEATTVQFPGLSGVVPHNSPATFGHFGGSGTFLWVDPDAGTALACLTDLDFGPWALEAWPRLSDAVLAEPARGSPPSTPGTRPTRGPT